jgi:hypothetical protein
MPPPRPRSATRQLHRRHTLYSQLLQVSHPQFGDGSVTAIDVGTLTVAFVDHQVKQILDYYVKRQKK